MTIYEINGNEVKKLITLNYSKEFVESKYGSLKEFVKYLFSIRDIFDKEGKVIGQTKPRFLYSEDWVLSYVDINDPVLLNGKIVERPLEVEING